MTNSQLKSGDILLNITGASIGRCTFVPKNFGESNVNQHVCIIRPCSRLNYRFLSLFLSSPMGQCQIFSTFTGASRQGLSHKDLGLIRIRLSFPIRNRMKSLVLLTNITITIDHIRKCIESQIITLLVYRKSLIHECVTGKRRIAEADVVRVQDKATEEWRTKQK